MRKLILTGVLIFTLILSFVCVKKGITFPGKVYSYNELKTESNTVNSKMDALTRMKSTSYAASESALQTSVKKHLEIKTNYDRVASTKTEEQKQKALLGQDYDLSYLWVKLGNYATKNNCDLTLEVSQEKDATDDDKYILCNLRFKTVSGYDGVTSFIEDIEVRLMLVTEFYKTDVPISKSSLSKVENEQTLQAEEAAALQGNTTNTTGTSNTASSTNTTNTAN